MVEAVHDGRELAHYLPPWADVSIIGIAGSSGSGKSTLSRAIVSELSLPWVVILSMDSFYKTLDETNSKLAFQNEYDFDSPDAIDFDVLVERLRDLKAGLKETTSIYSPHVLILEGILALYDPRVLELLDMKIFCEADADTCLSRRILRDVEERGRDIEGCIKQWFAFVKPNFERYVEPQRKVADIIVPRGVQNRVAINMVIQYIERRLLEKSTSHRAHLKRLGLAFEDQPLSDRVLVLGQTPQVRGMNTIIQDIGTDPEEFVFYFDRMATLLVENAMNNIYFAEKVVQTATGHKYCGLISTGETSAVVILRGGAALETGLKRVIPDCRTGRVLIQSNIRTGEPELHYLKLPENIHSHNSVLLLDPQMSSGGAALMAVQVLLDHGVSQDRIVFVTYFAARDVVLLPGIKLRIHVPPNRPDVPALLLNTYSRAASKTPGRPAEGVPVVCVPLNSPVLNKQGQRLISQEEQDSSANEQPEINPWSAKKEDLFGYGVVAKILGVEGGGNEGFSLLVEGVNRVQIDKIKQETPYFEGTVTYKYDPVVAPNDDEISKLFLQLKSISLKLAAFLRLTSLISRSSGNMGLSPLVIQKLGVFIRSKRLSDAGFFADFMVNIVDASFEERLQILSTVNIAGRLRKAVELVERQVQNFEKNVTITHITSTSDSDEDGDRPVRDRSRMPNRMARYPLPKGFSFPPGLPGMNGPQDDEKEPNEMDDLKKKLEAAKLSPEAAKVAERELKRLKKMSPAQAEYSVIRNYLENLAEIPWTIVTEDRLGADTLSRARKQLDDDHYGLEKVKKRLLEYLAVLKLKQSINENVDAQVTKAEEDAALTEDGDKDGASAQIDTLKAKRMVDKSPIMLLVGPPGVGKTSLAKSVATALGRKFHRISLGGVRDEAEIRGHRRTYVAAMPGLIVNGLKKVGVANPVFLLDEIDKVGGSNFHGDPSAAMLEVLDPEQNHTFMDHYINIPIDLSKVLFIATANSLDTIPAPLLDRMETIYLSGYTTLEKRHIAQRHLIPKQIRTNGLEDGQVKFNDEVVAKIIESYTRESGVRNLEREIGSVCRAKAVEYADAKDSSHLENYNPQLSVEDVEEILGIERFEEEIAEQTSRPGIVTGLVAYSSGGNGSILFIEVADMPGNGTVQLTGTLGDVLKESVEVALTWVKAHAFELGLTHDSSENIMKNRSIHDGPSAGMAHTIALISLFSGKAVPPTVAMTGEISLRGRVTAVGGIKEKLIGALRAGVKTVLLPAQNRKDVKDLPQEVKEGLQIIPIRHIWEAMRHIWPDSHWPGEENFAGIESRL
ncbi:hypothetical protein B7463_g3452, partial [Scytalidium lignicola]